MRRRCLLVKNDAERRRGDEGDGDFNQSCEWAGSKSQGVFYSQSDHDESTTLEDERVDSKLVYVALMGRPTTVGALT